MQKSASTANAQGKLCGLALSAQIGRRKPQPSHYANIVYSLINDREAASTVNLYRGDGHRLEAIDKAGGNSPSWSESEAEHARSWLNSILVEMSG
jgi:hypothetical protein